MAPPALAGEAPQPGKYLKISMFFKKHPNVTDNYFHAYWANNHVEPLLKLTKFGDKVRKYNQHHITPELREQAKAMGMPVMDFDGVSEVWVDSLEDWISIVRDPEFRKAGSADAGHFITSPATIMFGYDHQIIGE